MNSSTIEGVKETDEERNETIIPSRHITSIEMNDEISCRCYMPTIYVLTCEVCAYFRFIVSRKLLDPLDGALSMRTIN